MLILVGAVVVVGIGVYTYIRTYTTKDTTTQVVRITRATTVRDPGYGDAARRVALQTSDPWHVTAACQRSADHERRVCIDRRAAPRGGPDRRRTV